MTVRHSDPAGAVDLLTSPFASEDLSILSGCTALVVDGAVWPLVPATIPEVPCVTIAVVRSDGDGDGVPALAASFDVVLAGDDADTRLREVLDGVERSPHASLALVQLLRMGMGDVAGGLALESFVYGLLQSGPDFQRWLRGRPLGEPPLSPSDDPPVLVERDNRRCRVVLNRPHVRNALDTSMRDALVEALRAAAEDEGVEEVVLSGNGPAFCSGGDLNEFGTAEDPVAGHMVRSTRSPAYWAARCGLRLRAKVHGACVGAGIELPAFARVVQATEDAFFLLPEVAMGLVPGSGGTVSLPRRIGRHRTAELAISGRRLDAQSAEEWGLVDQLV